MTEQISYTPKGVCSRQIIIEIENGVISQAKFVGGCAGNTQGVCALLKGLTPDQAISRLQGIKCGFKSTSCPDQLALALIEHQNKNKGEN